LDTARAAHEALKSARDEIRVAREHADYAARNARAERGEAEEPVVDRRSRAREIASATQRGIDNRLRLYRERDQAAQEPIQGANDTLRQSTTPPQAEAITDRAEERARLVRARDQARENQTYEQRILRVITPEEIAYDRFVQEPNSYSTSRLGAEARFRRHLARKPVRGERGNKKSKTMAKCPFCDKLTSSRDKQALRRDIDVNSASV
jgi:hypothetical protein